MTLFRVDIYRNHRMVELLVRAENSEAALKEVKRCWRGWRVRGINSTFMTAMIWKINEWSTDDRLGAFWWRKERRDEISRPAKARKGGK